jgi:HEPN domain-containing protein
MNEKLDIVRNWIESGDHDLGTARLTFKYIPKYHDTITFHCQQAVEKYLKGYLLFLGINFKRSHDLNYLLSLISQKEELGNEWYDKAAELEDFSVEIRYPDSIIELTDGDVMNTLTISGEFRDFVLSRMKLTMNYLE